MQFGGVGLLMEFKIIAGVLVAILTIAFYPAYIAMVNKVSSDYIVNGSLFGQGGFHANFTFKTFLNITLKAMGLGLGLAFVAFLISILFSSFSAFLELLTASTMPQLSHKKFTCFNIEISA